MGLAGMTDLLLFVALELPLLLVRAFVGMGCPTGTLVMLSILNIRTSYQRKQQHDDAKQLLSRPSFPSYQLSQESNDLRKAR